MLTVLNRKLRRFCSRLRWPIRRRHSRLKIVIKKLGKSSPSHELNGSSAAAVHPNGHSTAGKLEKPVRIATFNAVLFSMASAVPPTLSFPCFDDGNRDFKPSINQTLRTKSANDRPRSILKQSPLHPSSENSSENLTKKQRFAKSRLRVSINLPDNEISLKRSGQLSFVDDENEASTSRSPKGKAPLRSTASLPPNRDRHSWEEGSTLGSRKTVVEVLRELEADIVALQDVKAEEEREMKPLSDLARALGMNYVFAESWAPEYGNAILSRWPIRKWKVQKIFDDTDFRNVLKATIDVPHAGELNFHCTLLDHLDEKWRMKQMNAVIQSNDEPHILAGGLNSLDETDYSAERWTDIVKYYEEMGKPTPKVEVMKFLKSKQYVDAKEFAGECESVVMIAKGQSVQGTCKYGTRVDYILASPDSPCKFVPGSYSVFSSKGTSDHHIVKVDIIKADSRNQQFVNRKRRLPKQKIVKITNSSSSKGIWKINGEIDR